MIGRKQQMHMKIYSDHIKEIEFIIIPVIEASEKEVKSLVFII